MAESTFSYGYSDFKKEASFQFGFDMTEGNHVGNQTDRVEEAVKRGIANFLTPPHRAHRWSFMYPKTSLSLVSGTDDYTMDDDFGGIFGAITFGTSDGQTGEIVHVPVSEMNQMREINTHGTPRYYTLVPIEGSQSTGTRQQMQFYPFIDESRTVYFQMFVLFSKLTDAKPYAPGNATHGQVQLQCVKAAVESMIPGSGDAEWNRMLRMLDTAIDNDNWDEPDYYGQMNSGLPVGRNILGTITVNGTPIT